MKFWVPCNGSLVETPPCKTFWKFLPPNCAGLFVGNLVFFLHNQFRLLSCVFSYLRLFVLHPFRRTPPNFCRPRTSFPVHVFFQKTKKGFQWVASAEASARFCGAVWLYGTEDSTRAVPCRLSGVPTLETSSLQCWHLVGAQGQGPGLPLITADATHLPKRDGFGFL